MAKFGRYTIPGMGPADEFDGDSMQQEGEYVKIWKTDPKKPLHPELVAAIRLDKGQFVKKISD
jgi:hypothetical protein